MERKTIRTSPSFPPHRFRMAKTIAGRTIVPNVREIRRVILQNNHDLPTTGHPGRDKTLRRIQEHYWWPGIKDWVTEYIKGCTTCQQSKLLTHRKHIPLYCIPTENNMPPFQFIAMDLITGLPAQRGLDAILTIIDHGCSKAALYLPCSTHISGAGITQLYLNHIYPWYGLPRKIISNRDPRFTSHFGKALTKHLGIQQNLSTTAHPQTDRLSEWKNQWVEQYLRLVTGGQPKDWLDWLAIATAVHNNWKNSTTSLSPKQILLGIEPTLHPSEHHKTNNKAMERRVERMEEAQEQATRAINKKAAIMPLAQYKPRDQVWLEATHLKLPHQGSKLNLKWYIPFKILNVISPVAFKLDLPVSWTIHPVFHASLLTPYVETHAHGPNYSQPPPDLINDEEQYEVEQIRSHQHHRHSRMLQYLIKWQGYPESGNTWEPADQVYVPDLLWEYHKHWPLESIKGKQKPLAKTTTHTTTLSKLPTIASQWPSLPLHSLSSSPVISNMSQSLSLTSLSTPPCIPTLYPPTRLPSPGPSMTSRPMPSGTDPFCPTPSGMSLQDMRISPLSNYKPSSQASPPLYSRGRRSIIVRLTISGSTLWMSTWSVAPSSSESKTLMVSPYYAPMDSRTTTGGSLLSQSPAQMGRALISSSGNWTMAEWQDLAPEQEVSMMLTLLTSLPYCPSTTNLSSPSPTGSAPASGVTTPASICFRRPSSPSTTGASSPRSNDTMSWTKRLPCYRQSLAWWTWTLQCLSLPRRPVRTILSPHKWQRRLSQWGLSISNCR